MHLRKRVLVTGGAGFLGSLLCEHMRESQIVDKALPSDDPRQRQPDITLARQALGWQPATSLEEGIPITIAYFEEALRRRSRHEAGV
jgi:nucleoside-diphosphate-sugar epimerase